MNMLRNSLVGIVMLAALMTVPGTALATTDSDLVGLWHMDGDWKDASVAGNHGTPINGVTFSSNAKVGAQAGSFDGTNDYVAMPINPSLNFGAGDFSVEYWLKVNDTLSTTTTEYGIINKNSTYEKSPGWGMELSTYASPAHTCTLKIFITSQNLWGNTAASASINVNTWYHVVGIRQGTSTKLYINGELKALKNHADAALSVDNTVQLIIGKNSWGPNFPGLLDEVAIYKRALSDTEIQEHYRDYVVNRPTVNNVTTPTTSAAINLSGTKPANTAIVVNGTTVVPLDGTTSWQANYTLLPGTNAISVTALDSQNRNSLPVSLTVVLDTTPPQVKGTSPVNNAVSKVASGAVTFTIADALSPLDFPATLNGATVKNASGFNVPGTWSSSGSGTTGTITFTPAAALSEGLYTATIRPTDTLANGSNYTLIFTIDSTPPVAPGIDPVTVPINTTSKIITGTRSSDSAGVAVSCAGAISIISYPTATTWSVNVSGLQVGSNMITASAVDTAGNLSPATTATIIVDVTPPAVGATPAGGTYNSTQSVALAANEPAVIYYTVDGSTPTTTAATYSQPIDMQVSAILKYFARDLAGNESEIKTGNYVIDATPPVLAISTLSDGAYTNNEIMNIAGTVTDNTGVTGVTLNDTAVQVNADGSFSHALLLKSGVNSITIAATDSAANMATDTRTVTLDQTAPVLAVTKPADNSKTGKMLLEVSGTVDETSVVTVKIKDLVQSAIMNGGAFSATIILEPGYNTIEITAADLAGNRSTVKRTVVFDDQVPSLAVTEPNQDIRTNRRSLTIKGTVSDALTAVGVTISKDSEIFTPAAADGIFEQAVNLTEEKTYGIVVTAMNEVGTSTSVQRNVIFDITPPVLTIDPVPTSTDRPSLSVTGTREAGTAVNVSCATATVGEVSYPTATTWQAGISGLREGDNLLTAVTVDAAGNTARATVTVILATRPPQITVSATPEVIWPPNRHLVPVTIAGGVTANGADIKSVSISVSDEYGKYEYNNLTFGSTVMLEAWRNENDKDGRKYTITAVVTDRGGLKTVKTVTVTVPHDMSVSPVKPVRSR